MKEENGQRTDLDPHGPGSTLASYLTTYAYDAPGNLTGVIPPAGQPTQILYDSLSRKTHRHKGVKHALYTLDINKNP